MRLLSHFVGCLFAWTFRCHYRGQLSHKFHTIRYYYYYDLQLYSWWILLHKHPKTLQLHESWQYDKVTICANQTSEQIRLRRTYNTYYIYIFEFMFQITVKYDDIKMRNIKYELAEYTYNKMCNVLSCGEKTKLCSSVQPKISN